MEEIKSVMRTMLLFKKKNYTLILLSSNYIHVTLILF